LRSHGLGTTWAEDHAVPQLTQVPGQLGGAGVDAVKLQAQVPGLRFADEFFVDTDATVVEHDLRAAGGELFHQGVDAGVVDVRLEGQVGHHLQPQGLAEQAHVVQVLLAGFRVRAQESHTLRAQALGMLQQGAEFFLVFGTHREHQRLVWRAKCGRARHGAEKRHLEFGGRFHHRGGRAAFDGAEHQKDFVLGDQLTRIGFGLGRFVVVVQHLHHHFAACNATLVVDLREVGFDAIQHRGTVVVFATLQGDALSDQQLLRTHAIFSVGT
jgi:hypothetical protein